ncbi:peptide-methionine (R)-S-oxide reductase MsrB [Candidatus Gracilibacteria bacterium]|nr:peptide-methionine (R)-S-oxide reductase MsrB [Candidatus Gracilibacteria bacterium]
MNKTSMILSVVGVIALTVGLGVVYGGVGTVGGKQVENISTQNVPKAELKDAYFAGGCFWCMEEIFEKQPGVASVEVGYTGGSEETATYEQTSTKTTDHREAVHIEYDPNQITYRKLVELYFTQIDPTDDGGQFNDRGYVYSPAIYYSDTSEKITAQLSKNELSVSGRFDEPIVVTIEEATPFYRAEEYHQGYYKNNSIRYKVYTAGSGRKDFIKDNWQDRIDELEGKDYVNGQLVSTKSTQTTMAQFTETELREKLTPLQYSVTQEDGTEPPFDNEYWDNKEAGIYVDVVDGTPLYSSLDKYDSGTGWPSFTKSLNDDNLVMVTDTRFFMKRTAIDSATSGAHLGHLFNDGPKDQGGLRHCINSASMRFVPVADLDAEGYGEYVEMFQS